jgi:predicted RNase H-like HicB family nuclease
MNSPPLDVRRNPSRNQRAAVPYCRAKELPVLTIDVEMEEDGRWIGEVTALPGVMVYGTTEAEARQKAAALALRVIADRIEHGEPLPEEAKALFASA